jgi:hypothetical protein
MKETIHEAFSVDRKTIPYTMKKVFCGDTLDETLEYLEKNGGGIYRNTLHNFQFSVHSTKGERHGI